jgi:hypothetical protein
MNLLDWQIRWGVPHEAMADLRARMGLDGMCAMPTPHIEREDKPGGEAYQQKLVRLEAPQFGVWLTRNNVGAYIDKRGIPVRYGLANESKQQNAKVKSADLIGMKSIQIEQRHVGSVFAQFVSREIKEDGWVFNAADPHEVAQRSWCNFVLSKGGDAAFCTGPGSFTR